MTRAPRPILFSASMVRAILSGVKTETRRIVKCREPISHIGPAGTENDPHEWGYAFDGRAHAHGRAQHGYMVLGRGKDDRHDHGHVSIPCPYGDAGDRLWVRETWAVDKPIEEVERKGDGDGGPYYRADEVHEGSGLRWRSPIHMPRSFSRITLEVNSVRVERLHQITEDGALREGVAAIWMPEMWSAYAPALGSTIETFRDPSDREGLTCVTHHPRRQASSAVDGYRELWTRINGADSWHDNPWVWVIAFAREESGR